MNLQPRIYARTLLILLREHSSVRELSQRSGLGIRAIYKLYNVDPETAWTVSIQTTLEEMVDPAFDMMLADLREPQRPMRFAGLQKESPGIGG